MRSCKYSILMLLFFTGIYCLGQSSVSTVANENLNDSVSSIVTQKYVSQVNNKIAKYRSRMSTKTAKTLTRLSRWENKVHSLLQKSNPQAAERLFGNNQTTFNSLLQKIKDGETVAAGYKAQYDGYIDKLSSSVKYLQEQKAEADSKLIEPLKNTGKQIQDLQQNLGQTEYIKAFIKERKHQLFTEAVKYIGNSKYLGKINKESYYYAATLQNYKEIFSDTKKTEAIVKEALNKIPAFQQFMQKNSQLASLFNLPGSNANADPTQALAGLQTRASVQGLIQQRIAAGGPNAMAQVQQNLSGAHAEMDKLKEKISQAGGGSSDMEMPDFKVNQEKSKTLFQRLEYGFNVQFSKNNTFLPSRSDLALTLGFKMNEKSVIGIGASYKLGLGNIQHINLTSQGLGFRSYLDWKGPFGLSKIKLLSSLWLTSGVEMNYNNAFKNIEQLKNYPLWQKSALLGISKKYQISKKVKGNMQVLYDFLARERALRQPLVFRLGYNF